MQQKYRALLASDYSVLSRLYHRCHGLRPGAMVTTAFSSYEEYVPFHHALLAEYHQRELLEDALLPAGNNFSISGRCYSCDHAALFDTSFLYAPDEIRNGKRQPNWREHLTCTRCQLNNRLRASLHFLERNLGCTREAAIYITEQTTPLYHFMQQRYRKLVGSEYFGERIPYGSTDPATGLRNESITKLSFAADSFDYVLSFDVFEHVPQYQSALGECARVLKPGGTMLFTVPFDKGSAATLVRAQVGSDGHIEHLLPAEYHGDPVDPDNGCLCFHTFGWDLLTELRQQGFATAEVHFYWSRRYAYLGTELMLMTARKAG